MTYYNLNSYWSNDTFILYVAIIIVTFLSCLTFKKKIRINKHKISISLLIPFMILLFFKGFSATGRDLNTGYYIDFYSSASLSTFRDQSVEIGYKLFNVIIFNVFHNYAVFVFITALVTIIPVFYIINKYKDLIDVPCALLIYTSIFYFSGFSAMRAAMAYSILLLSFDSLYEKKNIKAFILLLLASSLHVTCLIAFIPYFVVTFKKINRKISALLVIGIFVFVYLFRASIVGLFVGRYSIYDIGDSGIGLKYFLLYVPQFILFYFASKKNKDVIMRKASLTYMIIGFGMGILSYSISIFGRVDYLFTPMLVYIPYYIRIIETTRQRKRIIYLATFAWCFVIFWLFINDNYLSQNLMPYQNIFGIKF